MVGRHLRRGSRPRSGSRSPDAPAAWRPTCPAADLPPVGAAVRVSVRPVRASPCCPTDPERPPIAMVRRSPAALRCLRPGCHSQLQCRLRCRPPPPCSVVAASSPWLVGPGRGPRRRPARPRWPRTTAASPTTTTTTATTEPTHHRPAGRRDDHHHAPPDPEDPGGGEELPEEPVPVVPDTVPPREPDRRRVRRAGRTHRPPAAPRGRGRRGGARDDLQDR